MQPAQAAIRSLSIVTSRNQQALLLRLLKVMSDAEMLRVFKSWDVNGDGRLQPNEIATVLSAIDPKKWGPEAYMARALETFSFNFLMKNIVMWIGAAQGYDLPKN